MSFRLKPIHGMNGLPISIMPGYPPLEDQFNQMGIPFIRLHDGFGIGDIDNGMSPNNRNTNMGQMLGNVPIQGQSQAEQFVCDISNKRSIFPKTREYTQKYGKNAIDKIMAEANYEPTDAYLKKILNNERNKNEFLKRQILFRIGRTLDGGADVPDADIYARLAKELVYRYSYAADPNNGLGFIRNVMDWEIWNEPDLSFFFDEDGGTAWYAFYEKIANAMKEANPAIRVGGPGTASLSDNAYTHGFINYCARNKVPLDIFSYHIYSHNSDTRSFYASAIQVRKWLDDNGLSDTLIYLTEWAPLYDASSYSQSRYQSPKGAAFDASALMMMAYGGIDGAFYYRGDAGALGIFNNENGNDGNPSYAVQIFYLFNQMFETPNIITSFKNDYRNSFITPGGVTDVDYNLNQFGIFYIAGVSDDNRKIKIYISTYYLVDGYFYCNGRPEQTPPETTYKQHYVDYGRTISQLNRQEDWDIWFGGKNPQKMLPGLPWRGQVFTNHSQDEVEVNAPPPAHQIMEGENFKLTFSCPGFAAKSTANMYIVGKNQNPNTVVPVLSPITAKITSSALDQIIVNAPYYRDSVYLIEIDSL